MRHYNDVDLPVADIAKGIDARSPRLTARTARLTRGTPLVELNQTVIPTLWVVLAAVVLSCFFALASCSLRAFGRVGLEEAFSGPRGKRRLETLATHLKALRLTMALCRSVANSVLVISLVVLLAGPPWALGPVLGAVCAATALIAVFGVAIPQAWASYAGEKVLSRTFPVLMAVRYALYPITALMGSFDLPVRRLAGVHDDDDDNAEHAKQEILQVASEGHAEGAVDDQEIQMIESVMELSDTRTAEIMTPRTDIFALASNTPWEAVCEQIIQAGHTRVPVYDGDIDNIIGILYVKDLLAQVVGGQAQDLSNILRAPYFVPETKPLDDLLRQFKSRKVHLAVALDEYGGTAGIVTIEDILEEIVGDIADEYDQVEPELVERVNETTIEADGRLHIDDLNDALNLEVPEDEDYDTIAGLVFAELGYIPTAGETLTAHGATFTVLDASERKLTRLRVEVS